MRVLTILLLSIAATSCGAEHELRHDPDYTVSDEPSVGTLADPNLTLDELAYTLLAEINPLSIEENTEHHWLIYRHDDTGALGYTQPIDGGAVGGAVTPSKPIGTTLVAFIHTHGDYSRNWRGRVVRTTKKRDAFNSDNFSDPGDVQRMQENALGAEGYYLGTPSGVFFKWEGEQVVLEPPAPTVAPCADDEEVLQCLAESCANLEGAEFNSCYVDVCGEVDFLAPVECSVCIAEASEAGMATSEVITHCSPDEEPSQEEQ